MQAQKRVSSTARNVLWRNMLATSVAGRVYSARAPSAHPKNERNKISLTLAPNRAGSLGVLWNLLRPLRVRCSTVLGFNPQKSADKYTGTRMSRHTDPSSFHTNTRSSSRRRV